MQHGELIWWRIVCVLIYVILLGVICSHDKDLLYGPNVFVGVWLYVACVYLLIYFFVFSLTPAITSEKEDVSIEDDDTIVRKKKSRRAKPRSSRW